MKIKKDDQILIIAGKDKGRKGKVLESFPKEGKLIVEGMNMRKKHIKPKKSGEKGQVVNLPTAINISNIKLICKNCGKAVRIEYKIEGKKKYRICKKCRKET